MSLVFNEQTKLLATAFTAATSCFTVGIDRDADGGLHLQRQ